MRSIDRSFDQNWFMFYTSDESGVAYRNPIGLYNHRIWGIVIVLRSALTLQSPGKPCGICCLLPQGLAVAITVARQAIR